MSSPPERGAAMSHDQVQESLQPLGFSVAGGLSLWLTSEASRFVGLGGALVYSFGLQVNAFW